MRRGLVRRYMDGPVVRRGRARRQGAGLLSSRADGQPQDLLGGCEKRAALGREEPAGLGEDDRAPAAVEQRHAELAMVLSWLMPYLAPRAMPPPGKARLSGSDTPPGGYRVIFRQGSVQGL